MKTAENLYRVKSIAEMHEIAGFEKPRHPLISIIDYSTLSIEKGPESGRFVMEFYSVNYKKHCSFRYGRQYFDHQEGTLLCTAPGQVIVMDGSEKREKAEGWGLFFHPEFIRNTILGEKIKEYTFFNYEENEALHLASDEQETLLTLLRQMEREYRTNTDKHSKGIMISNLELLLNYCKRYYDRQFITRTNQNKDLIAKFEQFISGYIQSDELKKLGIPSVKYCAQAMNLSTNYFSDLLKCETGRSAQEHIHQHLLEKVKELLLSSDRTIHEIAIEVGFEYPQNLTKLFKKKTGFTPSEYRKIETLNN